MLVKIIKSYREIVSICDSDLIGRTFEEGNFQLDLKESFYNGDEMSEEQTLNLIKNMSKEDATFNIVGEKSVNTALKAGIIEKEGIKNIQNIPFALVLL